MTDWNSGCFIGGRSPNGVDIAPENIGVFSRNNNNQSIAHNTWTYLNLTDKRNENPVGMCDLALDRITMPREGRYVICTNVQMDVYAGTTTVAIELWKNGSLMCQHTDYNSFTSIHSLTIATVDWCSVGDYYKVRMFQNSGLTAYLISSTCDQAHFAAAAVYVVPL